MILAYLAEQQVHLVRDDGTQAPIVSKFVEDVRRREASLDRKTSWKKQGTGARFMGAAALWDDAEGRRQPAFFTCVARGRTRGEILYALTTGVVSGLFAYDLSTGEETRLVHGTDGVPHSVATSDDHSVVAFTRTHKNGSCNVAVMRDDGGESALVTDGDTVDGAPSWVPVGPEVKDGRHQLVYHSSGIGRDAAGMLAGFAPSEIHLLDAEHGTLKTIVSDPQHDYLAPRMTRDGTLFAMKRPYRRAQDRKDAAAMLKDSAMAPFRLMYAGFRYLDFFTMRYTGKPLTTSGDTRGRRVDARKLLERQNVAGGPSEEEEEASMRAPREWVLVKRTPAGAETVVADAVCAYDVSPGGAIVVSDGGAIDRVDAQTGARKRVADGVLVTSVVALGA